MIILARRELYLPRVMQILFLENGVPDSTTSLGWLFVIRANIVSKSSPCIEKHILTAHNNSVPLIRFIPRRRSLPVVCFVWLDMRILTHIHAGTRPAPSWWSVSKCAGRGIKVDVGSVVTRLPHLSPPAGEPAAAPSGRQK